MNSAIIVAAGRGTRFGGDKPKQFLEICGKPVIVHTLERFENCAAIDEIILVLHEQEKHNFSDLTANYNFQKLKRIVSGGETRAESVWNGLSKIDGTKTEIVAVHDGARPLVTSEEIEKTIEKAKENGAAVLAAPVNDTIKEITSDGKILQTIDRAKLRRALTPQCFRYEILRRAFENLADFNESVTDECYLVEKLNVPISIVEGSARNIKITHTEDLILAEALLKQMSDTRF